MMQHAAPLLHFFVVSTSRLLSMLTHLGQESLLVKNTHGVEDQQGSFQETVETKGHVWLISARRFVYWCDVLVCVVSRRLILGRDCPALLLSHTRSRCIVVTGPVYCQEQESAQCGVRLLRVVLTYEVAAAENSQLQDTRVGVSGTDTSIITLIITLCILLVAAIDNRGPSKYFNFKICHFSLSSFVSWR